MITQPLLVCVAALIGLCLGSYATTAAIRFCRSEQFLTGQSHCDHCNIPLSYFQTAPLLGYLAQRGRCRACGGPITLAHPGGELFGALIFIVTAAMISSPFRAILIAILGLVLLAEAVVDARLRRLPDKLTLCVAALALGLDGLQSLESVKIGLAAAAVSFGLLEILRRLFLYIQKRPGLGYGDVKLIAALALWLGLSTPWAVAIAAGGGLIAMTITRPCDGRLAFGPALSAAGWLVGLAKEVHLWSPV